MDRVVGDKGVVSGIMQVLVERCFMSVAFDGRVITSLGLLYDPCHLLSRILGPCVVGGRV